MPRPIPRNTSETQQSTQSTTTRPISIRLQSTSVQSLTYRERSERARLYNAIFYGFVIFMICVFIGVFVSGIFIELEEMSKGLEIIAIACGIGISSWILLLKFYRGTQYGIPVARGLIVFLLCWFTLTLISGLITDFGESDKSMFLIGDVSGFILGIALWVLIYFQYKKLDDNR